MADKIRGLTTTIPSLINQADGPLSSKGTITFVSPKEYSKSNSREFSKAVVESYSVSTQKLDSILNALTNHPLKILDKGSDKDVFAFHIQQAIQAGDQVEALFQRGHFPQELHSLAKELLNIRNTLSEASTIFSTEDVPSEKIAALISCYNEAASLLNRIAVDYTEFTLQRLKQEEVHRTQYFSASIVPIKPPEFSLGKQRESIGNIQQKTAEAVEKTRAKEQEKMRKFSFEMALNVHQRGVDRTFEESLKAKMHDKAAEQMEAL